MDIRPIDVHDDVLCERAHDIITAAMRFERPFGSESSLKEHVLDWRHDDPAERSELWGAWRDGELVGVATAWLSMEDNTDKMWMRVTVPPERRRQGIGSALLGRLVERAREAERGMILCEARYPLPRAEDHPYRRFLERHRFSLAYTEIIRRLPLPVSGEHLASLAEEARQRYVGCYTLQTHVGGLPEHLQQSWCDVENQLGVDAPTGDVDVEPESMTPERYREYLDLERRQGRVRVSTVAVDDATGRVVAYTDLLLPPDSVRVWQWGTMVAREHRGNRLGLAVKAENLRRLQADYPDREEVQTGNTDVNRWMVSINERLGFEVLELCPCFQRSLA